MTKDIGDRSYYEGVKDGALAGYLIVGKGNGYEGPMQVYVAFDNDGLVTGVKILKHSDTPSMVKKVSSDEAFHKQFVGKGISNSFAMGSEIQAVAGATFSSEGVAQAVKEAVTFLHASILK
ncbi:Electron transport complex subunit RsxG [bioreactor metagenome]|uniref:Electron transport complex subunit RsxG n=1 Tax=bioreactor metagenome TaxID=1076179 RepID=A0A645DRG2_9ZZZZ